MFRVCSDNAVQDFFWRAADEIVAARDRLEAEISTACSQECGAPGLEGVRPGDMAAHHTALSNICLS